MDHGVYRAGVGKSGVLEHKSGNIKIEEKLLWRAYRKSSMLFRMVPSATFYDLLFPGLGSQPPTKTPIAQERVKYGLEIWPEHSQGPSEQKPIKNYGKKGWIAQ